MRFKKIMSVLASAVMLSSTIGFAAAASYPEPFVTSGTEDGAVVVGANAAVSDWSAAIDVQANLQGLVTSEITGPTVVGDTWKVETTSDTLEIGESFADIISYIDKDDFSLLAEGEISTEKGTASYEQFLYFEDTASSFANYSANEDSIPGLYLKFASGEVIARYVIDFSTPLKSDIVSSEYEDIKDKEISFLGKTYVVTNAVNGSSGSEIQSDFTLMSGAYKGTVTNDEEVIIGDRTVSVVVSSATQAAFTVDGETTTKLAEGDTYKLADDTYLGVSDITYQNYAEGIQQSTIYLGADKLFLDDNSSLQVNAETINDARVAIHETHSSDDVSITRIEINMTAEDDLYVPVDGKLSENEELDEPQVLFTQNWDVQFKGLDTYETEPVKLAPTGSDKKYDLTFQNYDGDEITFPLFFTNNSGMYPGYDESKRLIINSSWSTPITKNDYFILNTADPTDDTKNARTYVLQYSGSDKQTDTSPQYEFKVLGGDDQEISMGSDGSATLKLGGATFDFINASSCDSKSNCYILLNQDTHTNGLENSSMSGYLRTKNNAYIELNVTNYTTMYDWSANAGAALGYEGATPKMIVTLRIDDATRDGDDYDVSSTSETVWAVTFNNASDADAGASISWSSDAVTDPDDSDISTYQTRHGVYIKSVDPSSSPLTLTSDIPDGYVKPLVYITSGDITVTPGSAGAGGTVLVVKDSEVSSVSGKNLVVVGGSCINTVAAKILGSEVPLCGAEFTEATEVGAGQYIIKTIVSPYSADKVAMLVAGYDAADTTNAVAKALTGVSSDADSAQVYPITSA